MAQPPRLYSLLALRDVQVTTSLCLSLNVPVRPYLGVALEGIWVTLTSRDSLASSQTRRCPGPVGLPEKSPWGNKTLRIAVVPQSLLLDLHRLKIVVSRSRSCFWAVPQQSLVAVELLSPNIIALQTGKHLQLADSISICRCGSASKTKSAMPQMLTPNGRRMSTMSTQDQDLDAASLHTIMTGSNETIISANKSMFFLEMNPFAPVSVVLLHMLCKVPVKCPLPKPHIISAPNTVL